jgi:hypothetical protein
VAAAFAFPGERDQLDALVRDERGSRGLAETVHDVEHALGQADLVEQLGEPRRRERRPLGRFEHDRVARGKARRDAPGGEH